MEGEILSNVKDSYTTESGGMIPLEVRKHHVEVADGLFGKALSDAGIGENEIEVVAFSNAPGLAPCLLEGMAFVKKVASRLGVPVVCSGYALCFGCEYSGDCLRGWEVSGFWGDFGFGGWEFY